MKTIEETRLARLELLIDEYGSAAELARIIGIDDSQLNQLKNQYKNTKSGKPRVIGSSLARRIETATKKPHGWMDQPVYSNTNKDLDATMELIRRLNPNELHKVKEIINLVREPETEKYEVNSNGDK